MNELIIKEIKNQSLERIVEIREYRRQNAGVSIRDISSKYGLSFTATCYIVKGSLETLTTLVS